jgi:hypothetical protein
VPGNRYPYRDRYPLGPKPHATSVYNVRTVPKKTKAGFFGAIAVILILGLQSIEHWTVIDTVLNGLRNNGPAGTFLASMLMSRLVPLVIAIAAIYLVLEGRSEKNEASLPQSVPSIDNAAMQRQSTGPVTQQVFLGGQPQLPPKPEEPKPRPNIRCLGPATTRLRLGMEGHGFYEDADGRFPESLNGVMVCFRNESSVEKKVAAVFDVRASISFLDDSGFEIGTGISEACWAGDLGRINFDVEKSHCVIVALVFKDGTLHCPYLHHVHTNWGAGLLTEFYILKARPKTIEVRLIRETDLLLAPCVFDFSMVDGQPILKERPSLSH